MTKNIEMTKIRNLDSNVDVICWVLDENIKSGKDRMKIAQIYNFLINKVGKNITRRQIEYVLKSKKNRKLFHKNKDGYKLMMDGKNRLLRISNSESVIMIEAGKNFNGKKIIEDKIFGSMQGVIKICDPYLTINVIDHISNYFDKKNRIEIITEHIKEKTKGTLSRLVSDLKREGFDIKIKVYSSSVLHDRYIIDDRQAWLSGYGFNDIGSKECFFVKLGEDIRQSMLSTFNNRWKISSELD